MVSVGRDVSERYAVTDDEVLAAHRAFFAAFPPWRQNLNGVLRESAVYPQKETNCGF